jgi:NTE family protein
MKLRNGRQQRPQGRRINRQARRAESHSEPPRLKLALALQGGGSHGAFTWGVLDRLLDEATSDIIGVTGTSAGAISGAILVDGLVGGGPAQARAKLRQYWEAVGATPGFGSFFSGVSGEDAANTALESIPACAEKMRQNLSPYDLSPSNATLRQLLSD